MAKVTINGETIKVKKGTTILNAAKQLGIEIPTLCFIEEINEIGFCRVCIVEVEDEQDLVSACNTEVTNGMTIYTDSKAVRDSRVATLSLLASKHRFDCWRCPKDGMCEFYDILKEHDILFEQFGPSEGRFPDQVSGVAISQDQTKCILCKRCVSVCNNVVTARVLKFRDDDGLNPFVSPTPGLSFDESGCIGCGQCVKVCPTGTLFETDHTMQVKEALRDSETVTVALVDDAVKHAIAEEFGYPMDAPFEEVEGVVNRALTILGFDHITSLARAEDLLVLEESKLLQTRLQESQTMPLFTSECPASVRYLEFFQPDYVEGLSPFKSPHLLEGAIVKQEIATKEETSIDHVHVVSIMPCTARKIERDRDGANTNGKDDIDSVLTVRELSKLIKRNRLDLVKLDPLTLDEEPLKAVHRPQIERVLNQVSLDLDNTELGEVSYKVTHGERLVDSEGVIKEATVKLADKKIKIAIVEGGAALKELFTRLPEMKKPYDYVQLSACPGACVNGGGMPIKQDMSMHDVIKRRYESYQNFMIDEHRNPLEVEQVQAVYNGFLQDEDNVASLKTSFSMQEYTQE